jgi:hypothetical protein
MNMLQNIKSWDGTEQGGKIIIKIQPLMDSDETHSVKRCPHAQITLLATNYTLFGIVAKVNQQAQTNYSPKTDTTNSYAY